MTAWNKIKISKVWESREDQDVHASPKDARTEVPTVSTNHITAASSKGVGWVLFTNFRYPRDNLYFHVHGAEPNSNLKTLNFQFWLRHLKMGKKKLQQKIQVLCPWRKSGFFLCENSSWNKQKQSLCTNLNALERVLERKGILHDSNSVALLGYCSTSMQPPAFKTSFMNSVTQTNLQ